MSEVSSSIVDRAVGDLICTINSLLKPWIIVSMRFSEQVLSFITKHEDNR